MSIHNIVDKTPKSLEEMCRYLADPKKTNKDCFIGVGVNPFNAANEMQFVQDVYPHESLKHPYIQEILPFDVDTKLDMKTLREVCTRIASVLILDERQVFGVIHFEDEHRIACHYIINYVGMDGSLYRQQHSVYYFRHKINEILKEYGLQPINPKSKI